MNGMVRQDNVLDNALKLSQARLMDAQSLDIASRGVGRGAAALGNYFAQQSPAGQKAQKNAFALGDAQLAQAENEAALGGLDREQREREIVSDLLDGVERAPEHLRQQAWTHAYGEAQRMKLDVTGIPTEYDEEVMQILQASLERPGAKMPASVQEFQFAQQNGFEGSFFDWRTQANGGSNSGFTLGPGQIRVDGQGNEIARGPAKPPSEPTSVTEYRFAQSQGETRPFSEWKASNNGGTTVNVGADGQQLPKPPAGMVWKMGPDGKAVQDERGAPIAIPFQGGPAMADAAAAGEQAAGRRDQSLREASVVTEDIGRAVGIIQSSNWPTTGLFGAALSSLPGSSAHDLNKMMDTIRSNSAFGALQKMRENSPTGGALGAVSERELSLLQSTIGSLEQSQGQQQVLDNLARVNNGFLDVVFGAGNGPKRMPVSFRQGDVQSRLEFLAAQYPDDPGRVQQIMQAEGLFQ